MRSQIAAAVDYGYQSRTADLRRLMRVLIDRSSAAP